MAAKLRERIELAVIFMDSARITSPKPGSSTRIIPRIASGVTSRGPIPVPPVIKINPQPCWANERFHFDARLRNCLRRALHIRALVRNDNVNLNFAERQGVTQRN